MRAYVRFHNGQPTYQQRPQWNMTIHEDIYESNILFSKESNISTKYKMDSTQLTSIIHFHSVHVLR